MLLQGIGLTKYFPVSTGWFVGQARGWIKAVDGVSVQVAEGETLGIVGESGSGKTTLAKLFLLLTTPTSGSLLFHDQEVSAFTKEDLSRYRRTVQAVFQDPYSSLNPRMRVADIVAEPLPPQASASRATVRERVAQALELVGLSQENAAVYPHEFNGGLTQTLVIPRTLFTLH